MTPSASVAARPKIGLASRLLLLFCRKPGTPDIVIKGGGHGVKGQELILLNALFPQLAERIRDKAVIDFGCGHGGQAMALARLGAGKVIGTELEPRATATARLVAETGMSDRVTIVSELPDGVEADAIISQNSFEHFVDADRILAAMRNHLAPDGQIYLTFSPPWLSPWGAHMSHFCYLPWVNLVFSEKTILQVARLFRPAQQMFSYRDANLAEMTLQKFETLVSESGLRLEWRRYDCSFGLQRLARTPLREYFVNRVSCILSHA